MNYLAHTLLSKNNIDYQLGNLLADPLKGKPWQGSNDEHYAGMRMHAAIDVFTDANAIFSRSKSRLRKKGYLKAVVIDMLYDYFLSKHWDLYVTQDLASFVENFNDNALFELDELPEKAASFIERIASNNVLEKYTDLEGLSHAYRGIDKRLSSKLFAIETTESYIPDVMQHYDAIEEDFLNFFPLLIRMFIEKSGAAQGEHLFKDNI